MAARSYLRPLRTLLALLASLAASAPAWAEQPPAPAHVLAAREQVDWHEAGTEAVGVLAGYLATDTMNPPGNELAGVIYLGAVLEQAGIPWRTIDHADGRASLVARLEGASDLPPLCLLSHIDVVPAESEHWSFDPWAGRVEDGMVYGRGALDMKGMGVLETMTLVWLKRLQAPLQRDVVLLAVADEEDGNLGMRSLVDEHWSELGCGYVINEGGLGIRDALFEGQDLHAISIAEKGYLWVRMVAEGAAGHGSVVHEGEAPQRLLQAMNAVASRRDKPRVTPQVKALLKAIGRHKGGVVGAALRSGFLRGMLVRPKLMKVPATRAALTDTVHLTGVRGASSPNVVPSRAEAIYDCRLLPGTDPEAIVEELRHLTRKVPGVSFEVIDVDPASTSEWQGDALYDAIARYAVEGRPEAVAAPVLSVGFTDSLYARQRGVRAYGYVPFLLTADEAGSIHGHDERVPVEQVHEGLRRLFSIVVDFAGSP